MTCVGACECDCTPFPSSPDILKILARGGLLILKSDSCLSKKKKKKNGFICFNENHLKIILSYLINSLSSYNISYFCPDFFCHVEKRFDEKVEVNLKIYDVIWEIILETMKFCQLIKYGTSINFSLKIMQKMRQRD